MSNNNLVPNEPAANWRQQTYVIGAAAGTLFGLLAAYLYARAASEDAQRSGKPRSLGTGELIGLGLAALGLIRQIAEMGKPSQKK
jgi:hypothetical protein